MNIAGICILAVIASIIAIALKQSTPQISLVLSLVTGVIILIAISAYLPVFTDKINLLISQSGVDKEYTRVLLKSVGICFICQFSSDICNDSGQSALATKVELAGKILILISALPLMEEILEIASSLLSG
ncbi:MAG: stage III sporulation protein AD [Clostridia bacterium]|nr:stage III sporulation protein AD [Clostridia bacterium]